MIPTLQLVAILGLGLAMVSFLPWLRASRAQLLIIGMFVASVASVLEWTPDAWAWARVKFEVPLWIMSHWGELEDGARSTILIIAFSVLGLVCLFAWLAYTFVWRSTFPDLVRLDETGAMARFGRVYRVSDEGSSAVVYWRADAHWTPPWRMERLTTSIEPEQVTVFKLGVKASRFEQEKPFTWRAVPLTDQDAVLHTTRVLPKDFHEWAVDDLEWKEEVAKKGAHGHLYTQRKKILLSRMDQTFLRPGRIAAKRPKEQVLPVQLRPVSEIERIQRMTDEASRNGNGQGEHS